MNLKIEDQSLVDKLVFVLVIQVFLMVLGERVYNYYFYQNILIQNLFLFVILTNFIIVIFVVKILTKYQMKDCYSNKNIKFMENTLKILRAERHDHINHIQSILGLIVSGEQKLALSYINDINKDTNFNNSMLNVHNASIRILLQNKKSHCESKQIEFKVKINSSITSLHMKGSDITTVFGNLIDNAIDSVSQQVDKKVITFIIDELKDYHIFMFKDSGPRINDLVQKELFKKGFSTKGTNRGYGMTLILNTLNKYNGKIKYIDEDKCFVVYVPKRG